MKPTLGTKRFFILFLVFVTISFAGVAGGENNKMVVVIDAGHGGKDPGTVGENVYEKDVVLPVALLLGEKIKNAYKDVEVIYTRDDDNFLELAERADVANGHDADLFISIHANAAEDKAAHGTESYVLGLHKTDATMRLMEEENSVILLEDDQEKYSDFDGSAESLIILQYMNNVNLGLSTSFAEQVQHGFEKAGRKNRGEKQAGFVVLYRTTMPSVLVEIGFVSNPDEEAYLMSEEGQEEIAGGIYGAFESFKAEYDKANGVLSNMEPENIETSDTSEVEEVEQPETNVVPVITTNVQFKVQIHTSATPVDLNPSNFKDLTDVDEYISNGFYKYTIGSVGTYEEAKDLLEEVKNQGFGGSFIVAFKGEERIMDLQQAITMSEGN